MSSLQAILEALSTLSNIEEAHREDLLSHREEVEIALNSLHSLLQIRCASSSRSGPAFGSSTCNKCTHKFSNTRSKTPPSTAPRSPPPDAATSSSSTKSAPSSSLRSSSAVSTPATSPPRTYSATSPSLIPPSAVSTLSTSTHSTSLSTENPATPLQPDVPLNEIPKSITRLIKLLREQKSQILQFMQAAPESVIRSKRDWSQEDPRIIDISQTDKHDHGSLEMQLRSGFSAISLADEYIGWEGDTKRRRKKSRIEHLYENLNSGNRGSFYKEFAIDRSFGDINKARTYVRYGIQLRVFMKIYSSLLDVNVETEPLGIAGIVSFRFWIFMRITFHHLPLLARLLLSEWGIFANGKDAWMTSCFQCYNVRISMIRRAREQEAQVFEPEGPRKRQRKESIPSISNLGLQPTELLIPEETTFRPLQEASPPSYRHVLNSSNDMPFAPIQDVNPLGYPHVLSSSNNIPFTPIQEVSPLGHSHFTRSSDNTSPTPIQEVDPLRHPHMIGQSEEMSFTPIQKVNPLGRPHLGEQAHNLSPLPLPSEQIDAAVRNVIAGIPSTNDYDSTVDCMPCGV